MLNLFIAYLITAFYLLVCASAQFPPQSVNTTRIASSKHRDVRIVYKSNSVCQDNGSVRNIAGYVHLPARYLGKHGITQPLPQNIFFWLFGSRSNLTKDPLTVYLNGGPGAASTRAIFREHGPCKVKADSRSTESNPWSWNEHSNMLYVDQPGNTGFSFDIPQNVTISLNGQSEPLIDDESIPNAPSHGAVGTEGIGANDIDAAINSTASVSRLLWEFLQIWLDGFPEYEENKLNIWTSSYGGHYAPALANFTLERNDALHTSTSRPPTYRRLNIDTLGMTNACMDIATQLPSYPEMALNNTYDIPLATESAYTAAISALHAPDGCLARIKQCHTSSQSPSFGTNRTTNSICHSANHYCGQHIASLAQPSGRNLFDIAYPSHILSSSLLSTHLGFLSHSHIQAALGVPVNYTVAAAAVTHAFARTGDNAKSGALANIAALLDRDVKVALVYGDRDFACNWMGGEAASLAIPHRYQREFARAGYQSMSIDDEEVWAQVRQHGNLSFVRVNDAAHGVAANQPRIARVLFDRVNMGVDVVSGRVVVATAGTSASGLSQGQGDGGSFHEGEGWYRTIGPNSTMHIRNKPPLVPEEGVCYTLNLGQCSVEQREAFLSGEGVVRDYFLVEYADGRCCPNPVMPCDVGGGLFASVVWTFRNGFSEFAAIVAVCLIGLVGLGVFLVYTRVRRNPMGTWMISSGWRRGTVEEEEAKALIAGVEA